MQHAVHHLRTRRAAAAVLAASSLLAAGCAPAQAPSSDTKAPFTPQACKTTVTPGAAGSSVTVYSTNGLMNTTDQNNWYNKEFAAFTKQTGIKVNYVEADSGPIEEHVESETAAPKADVLITLPPFAQKAALAGALSPYTPQCVDQVDPSLVDADHQWEAVMVNYLSFIYNAPDAASNPPKTWQDLLSPKYKHKLQYSTPGVAGDGTAVMIKAIRDMGSPQAAMAYFKQLQENDVGPSRSTGQLEAKVNSGTLLVANGDLRMNYNDQKNSYHNYKIFFLGGRDATPTTIPLPYFAGLVKNCPDPANGQRLIDFLLSEPAQLDTSLSGYGLPARTDVKPADANYLALQALLKNVLIVPVDWKSTAPDYGQYVTEWNKATGTP